MQPDNQLKNYKAVVVVKMLEGSGGGGVFVATTVVSGVVGGPDLQTQLFVESNWCKMRCYQPAGGAGTGVFSLQTNPTKNNVAVVLTEKNYKAVTAGGVFSLNALLSTFQQNQPNNQPKCACAPNNPTTN